MTEPIPPVGLYRTEKHAYYWNGEGPLPGVTTVINVLDKPAVVSWAKSQVAACAVRNLDTLVAHRDHVLPDPLCVPCAKADKPFDGASGARKWLFNIPDLASDIAKDLGTEVHRIAETLAQGEVPDVAAEIIPYAETYRRFIAAWRPTYLANEYRGIHRALGYAGTGDFIMDVGGVNVLVDIKTHTKATPVPATYYPQTALQLAACAAFEFIGRENDPTEYPVPRVDKYAVLLIGRDDYRLIEYRVTRATFIAFRAALALHRWQGDEAKSVVGSVLTAQEAAA